MPGRANITTAAGDVAFLISLGSGNWKCLSYTAVADSPAESTSPAFRAHKNGTNQAINDASSGVTLTWSTEDFDVGSYFASNTWTPPAGYVRLEATVQFTATNAVDSETLTCAIYKNGSALKIVRSNRDGNNPGSVSISVIDLANGTAAYDVRVTKDGTGSNGNGNVDGSASATWFQGAML